MSNGGCRTLTSLRDVSRSKISRWRFTDSPYAGLGGDASLAVAFLISSTRSISGAVFLHVDGGKVGVRYEETPGVDGG